VEATVSATVHKGRGANIMFFLGRKGVREKEQNVGVRALSFKVRRFFALFSQPRAADLCLIRLLIGETLYANQPPPWFLSLTNYHHVRKNSSIAFKIKLNEEAADKCLFYRRKFEIFDWNILLFCKNIQIFTIYLTKNYRYWSLSKLLKVLIEIKRQKFKSYSFHLEFYYFSCFLTLVFKLQNVKDIF
jgi:hypothetical protein